MQKETLIILYGGRSAEREVSVMSAENVVRAVNYDKFIVKTIFITKDGDFIKCKEYSKSPNESEHLLNSQTVEQGQRIFPSEIYEKDAVVFPVLHGPMGEDGSIQGFLEIMKMPFVGPDIVTAASTMDKLIAKLVFESVDIPQVPYVPAFIDDDLIKTIKKVDALLEFPVFVKPANMGSSVGISKVFALEDLKAALDEAFKYDTRIVIEQGVDAREVECAVLGNGENVQATYPGEVVKDKDFYDYKAKYIENKIEMAIPADIPRDTAENIRKNAVKAYEAVGGVGMSRCDFFVERQTGQIYLNEINSIPGFTQWSMYPRLWGNMGLSYGDLIEELVVLGKEAFVLREKHLEN